MDSTDQNSENNNNESKTEPIKEKEKSKSEFIDLFAAQDRKNIISSSSSPSTISPMPTTAVKLIKTDSSLPLISSANVSDSFSGRNSLIELQAELLRLEADKEQIKIDWNRIEEQKIFLVAVDNIILKLLNGSLNSESLLLSEKSFIRKELFFRIAELMNAATNLEERNRFANLYDEIMTNLENNDVNLFTNVMAEIKKDINLSAYQVASTLSNYKKSSNSKTVSVDERYDRILKQWSDQIDPKSRNNNNYLNDTYLNSSFIPFITPNMMIGGSNITDEFSNNRAVVIPSCLPVNLLPIMFRSPELSKEDYTLLKDAVFNEDILNSTKADFSVFLATFRGNPTISLQDTLEKANRRISLIPSLNNRVRLFLLPEYRFYNAEMSSVEKYTGTKFQPVFVILSKDVIPRPPSTLDNVGSVVLFLVSMFALFLYSVDLNSLNAQFLQQAVAGDDTVIARVLPIIGGAIGLQIIHDIGHYLVALPSKVKLSIPPYYLPSLQLGLFGSIVRFLTYPSSRKEMFDVSIAGPLFGFIASLLCTLTGLSLTANATPEIVATFPALPTGFFQSSFLIYELMDKYLHISTITDPTIPTPIHPLLAIGLTGLITNAFNSMPIGKLDGGRVAMAIGGRQTASRITTVTLIAQALSFITNSSPLALFWIILVVFLQRGPDIPPIDDVTPIATNEDDQSKGVLWYSRLFALIFCIILTSGVLLPVPNDINTFFSGVSSDTAANIATSTNIFQGLPSSPPPTI
eukprot:gene9953-13386_t